VADTGDNKLEEKIILKGIVATGYMMDNFSGIDLIQEDGYKVDLITRLKEFVYNYGKKITVRYWVAEKREEDENVKKNTLKKIMGVLEAEYETSYYEYSEYTSVTDYDTVFNIDKHNLYAELMGVQGKYLILEVEKATKSN